MATINHLHVTAAADDLVGEIELNGAVIIDGFLTTEVLQQFNAEINPVLENKVSNHAHPNAAVGFFHGAANPKDTGASDRIALESSYVGATRTTCVATMLRGGHAENALPQSDLIAAPVPTSELSLGCQWRNVGSVIRAFAANAQKQLRFALACRDQNIFVAG